MTTPAGLAWWQRPARRRRPPTVLSVHAQLAQVSIAFFEALTPRPCRGCRAGWPVAAATCRPQRTVFVDASSSYLLTILKTSRTKLA